MKSVVIGSRGMLGTELMRALALQGGAQGFDLPEIDIRDAGACLALMDRLRPALVLNAAAMTAVDYCESHEEEAFRVNAEGAGNLARAAAAAGARIVHFSTDYVFDGRKEGAYAEEDEPNPLGAYARSKAAAEGLVRGAAPDHQILRTSWLFGRHGKNFVRTILEAAAAGRRLRVVRDQRGSPTHAGDLAQAALRLARAGGSGVYHVTNTGMCTWFELARFALGSAGLASAPLEPVATHEYPLPAPRPANSVLANARMAREGFPLLRPWREAVGEYVRDFLGPGTQA